MGSPHRNISKVKIVSCHSFCSFDAFYRCFNSFFNVYDLAFLCCLPGIVVMAPSDEAELVHMVATAAGIDDRPSVIRYPRGEGVGVELPAKGDPIPIGKGRVVREGGTVAVLSLGPRLHQALAAADELAAKGFSTTVADARFAKPLDEELIRELAANHKVLITIEEGSAGGFGAHVMQFMAVEGLLDNGLKARTMTLPDIYIDHDAPKSQYEKAGLTAADIVTTALSALGRDAEEAGKSVEPARA